MRERSGNEEEKALSRRGFLKATAAGTLGLPLVGLPSLVGNAAGSDVQHEIKAYRPLGSTGWLVSDISFGGGEIADVGVLQYALDCGMNYIDTAEGYRNGKSEEVTGEAIKGRRDKVCVVTKYDLRPDGTKESYLERLNQSLKRLQSDYVDVMMSWGLSKNEELENAAFLEAAEQAKKDGKVRFLGFSCHDPNMEKLFEHALSLGQHQVVLVVYNFIRKPENKELFKKAREKGVGIVAMKALAGADGVALEGVKEGKISFPQAAFKWVLSSEDVSCLVATIASYDQIEEYLPASGQKFGRLDREILEEYTEKVYGKYCKACGNCLGVCTAGVAVPDIMRFGMYFENYGSEKRAMEEYARLVPSEKPIACRTCAGPCERVCSQGIRIRKRLRELDSLLTLSGGFV